MNLYVVIIMQLLYILKSQHPLLSTVHMFLELSQIVLVCLSISYQKIEKLISGANNVNHA